MQAPEPLHPRMERQAGPQAYKRPRGMHRRRDFAFPGVPVPGSGLGKEQLVFGTFLFVFAAGPCPSGLGRSATFPAGLRARAAAGVHGWEESTHVQAACPGRKGRLLVQPDHGLGMNRAARRGRLTSAWSHSAGKGSGTAP